MKSIPRIRKLFFALALACLHACPADDSAQGGGGAGTAASSGLSREHGCLTTDGEKCSTYQSSFDDSAPECPVETNLFKRVDACPTENLVATCRLEFNDANLENRRVVIVSTDYFYSATSKSEILKARDRCLNQNSDAARESRKYHHVSTQWTWKAGWDDSKIKPYVRPDSIGGESTGDTSRAELDGKRLSFACYQYADDLSGETTCGEYYGYVGEELRIHRETSCDDSPIMATLDHGCPVRSNLLDTCTKRSGAKAVIGYRYRPSANKVKADESHCDGAFERNPAFQPQ